MTWAPGPVVTRRRLGGELKRLRDRAGLKLEAVAERLECSPSKVSRLENGKGIPKYRDVRDMLDLYAVGEGEERDRLLEWSRTGQQPMWWSKYADVLPAGLDTYVELEWDASRIDAYEPHIVHGLLQTRDYARATLRTYWASKYSPAQIERMVDVRMKRQEALLPEHGLMFRCLLEESTLYRMVGSRETLRGQVEHLIGIAEAEHVDVRVLPFSAGLVPGSSTSFAKLEFSGDIGRGLIALETDDGEEFLSDGVAVAEHEARLAALLAASHTEPDSIPLMRLAQDRLLSSVEGPAVGV